MKHTTKIDQVTMTNKSNMNSMKQFAYSTSTVRDVNSINQAISLDEMISIIKNTVPNSSYKSIANTTINGLYEGLEIKEIKNIINPLKMNLPFFLFSGFQDRGHNNKDIQYNGFVQVDIDFKEMYGEAMAYDAKQSLSKLPYIIFAGLSPSGVGVKALVKTNNLDKDNHVDALKQVLDKISKTTNISIDYMDVVGAAQPVFAFYDADLYVNTDAVVFDYVPTLNKSKVYTNNIEKSKVKYTQNTAITKITALTDTKLQKALKISYNYAIKKRGNVVDTTFLQSYVGSTISFGIDSKDALDYLYTQGHSTDLNDKRIYSFNDMYKRYIGSFGTADISYNIEQPTYNTATLLHLEADQKVSDLDFDLTNNSIIQSPTASGKSYFVGNKLTMKRVMIVPTQSLVLQFAQEYNASPFYADAKDLTNTDFIVTTYKSFNNLYKLINSKEYTLFIDEAHNTSSSASHSFLLKELNEVVDLVGEFKNYHLLTATPLFNFHPALNNLELIVITKDITIKKNVNQLRYVDVYKTLQDNVKATVAKEGQFVVLSNNTDESGRLGRLQASLSNYNVVTINSTKKDEQSFMEVAIDGDMTNYEGMICTTVIKEGNSIIKHSDIIDVYVDGLFHPAEIEQFCSRFRSSTEINLFLMKPDSTPDAFCAFSLTEAAEEVKTLASLHEGLRKAMKKSLTSKKDQLNTLDDLCKHYFRSLGSDVVYDHLSMSNLVFEAEKKASNADYDYMTEYLSRFEWNDNGVMSQSNTMNDTDKKAMKVVIDNAKTKKEALVANIFNTLSTESIMTNEAVVESNSVKCKIEKDIRYKVNRISKYLDKNGNIDDAIKLLKDIGLATKSWNSFTKSLTVQKLKTNSEFMNDKTNDLSNFINEVYNTFKVGSNYSSDTINDMMIRIHNNNFPEATFSKTKTCQILATYFSINKKTVRINGGTSKEYTIVNTNPTSLSVDTDIFLEKKKTEEFDYYNIF